MRSGWTPPLRGCLNFPLFLQSILPEEEEGGSDAAELLAGLQEAMQGLVSVRLLRSSQNEAYLRTLVFVFNRAPTDSQWLRTADINNPQQEAAIAVPKAAGSSHHASTACAYRCVKANWATDNCTFIPNGKNPEAFICVWRMISVAAGLLISEGAEAEKQRCGTAAIVHQRNVGQEKDRKDSG